MSLKDLCLRSYAPGLATMRRALACTNFLAIAVAAIVHANPLFATIALVAPSRATIWVESWGHPTCTVYPIGIFAGIMENHRGGGRRRSGADRRGDAQNSGDHQQCKQNTLLDVHRRASLTFNRRRYHTLAENACQAPVFGHFSESCSPERVRRGWDRAHSKLPIKPQARH